jgi:hypothetical protein
MLQVTPLTRKLHIVPGKLCNDMSVEVEEGRKEIRVKGTFYIILIANMESHTLR